MADFNSKIQGKALAECPIHKTVSPFFYHQAAVIVITLSAHSPLLAIALLSLLGHPSFIDNKINYNQGDK
jgi:hypothetical protein